jgi:hypothetical protein
MLLSSSILTLKWMISHLKDEDTDFDWKLIANLIITSGLEVYLIGVALQATKELWNTIGLSPIVNEDSNYSLSSNVAPIGFSLNKFKAYYKNRYVLTARIFVTLDVVSYWIRKKEFRASVKR